jgi:5-methylthioadenosine/S-adenosylhomocysteine deaminase
VLGHGSTLRVVPALIEIRDGIFHAVTELAKPLETVPDGTLNLGERLIAPAFVNAHSHISMSCFRGLISAADVKQNIVESIYFRLESHLEAGDVYAFSQMGAYDSLLSGVGLVWDHYYAGEEVAQALIDVGVSGVVAPTIQDIAGPGLPTLSAQISTTEALATNPHYAKNGIFSAVGPHATDTVSDSLMIASSEMATSLSIPLHLHVAQSIDEIQRIEKRSGCSPIAHLDKLGVLSAPHSTMLVHALFSSEDDVRRLDPKRHTLAYCPWSQVQFGFPAPQEMWRNHGIPVALATDAGAGNDTMDVARELRALAWSDIYQIPNSEAGKTYQSTPSLATAEALWSHRQALMSSVSQHAAPTSVLPSVWSAAGGMHAGATFGEIIEGAMANLVSFNLDHPGMWPATTPLRALVLGDTASAIDGVMNRGRWVGERGNFQASILHSEAYTAAVTEARSRLEALLSRAGLSR